LGPDDADLLKGCLRGEKRAWDAFVDRYSKLVYWSIWKVLENRRVNDREDLCREVFQDFFRRILEPARMERLAAASSARKYVQVTAANLVSERLRRSQAAGRFELPEEAAQAAVSETVSDDALQNERRTLLEKVLAGLKPRERTCLELHYLDGKTHQEIGALLGLPQDTVSSLLRRTREKARESLKKKGLEESE
jgi:RNA polymerase sigma-70 factor, ECF subfamily